MMTVATGNVGVEIPQKAGGTNPFRSRGNFHSLRTPAAWCLCPDLSGRAAGIGKMDHPLVAV
eukprot:2741155-Amphidinium_carterae.1